MKHDHELITSFKTGTMVEKDQAFTALVRKYQEKVYWVCRRMLKSHDDADEVAQLVFIKVHSALRKFNEESEFFTWLYRIATNETINFIRSRNLRQGTPIDDLILEPASKESEPDEGVVRTEEREAIDDAIQSLPEKQRAVFTMRYYDELSYEEIAEILGTSVGGLKANYFHAFNKIQDYIKLRLKNR